MFTANFSGKTVQLSVQAKHYHMSDYELKSFGTKDQLLNTWRLNTCKVSQKQIMRSNVASKNLYRS